MKRVSFKVRSKRPLAEEFSVGFSSVGVKFRALGSGRKGPVVSVSLRRRDGSGVMVGSLMFDVGPRYEIGYLEISSIGRTSFASEDLLIVDLPEEFHDRVVPSILVYCTAELEVASGIVLEGKRGGELILVAAAAPFELAVKGLLNEQYFTPEYDLREYRRVPLTT